MQDIDVSVIIACYNPDIEKLKKTINSVLNQVEVKCEIIIADDGSKVDYRDEIEKWFADGGVNNYKLSFLSENQGTVINILSAVKIADGVYIKTISPSDYLYDEYALKNYVKVFTEKDADIVFGKSQYFTTDLKFNKRRSPKSSMVYHNIFVKKNVVLYGDCVSGAALAAKKDVIEKYLEEIKNRVKFLEDAAIIAFAAVDKKRILACNKKLVWYEYGEGISTNDSRKRLLDKDFEYIYKTLATYDDKFAKKTAKFWYAGKIKNPIKRLLKKIIISPSFIFFKAIKIFSFNLSKNGTIEQMNKITHREKDYEN